MSEQELFGLMAVAEEQQKAVNAAIAGLAQERRALASAIESIKRAAADVPKAAGEAASTALRETTGQATKTAQNSINQAAEALNGAIGDVKSAGAWLSWKLAGVIALVGGAVVLALYLVGLALMPAADEIRGLRAERAELQANIAELKRHGGKIKLSTCGPTDRLCVEITPAQGDAQGQRDFQGSWVSNDNRHRYVIPKGY